jgi:hypothetical protein
VAKYRAGDNPGLVRVAAINQLDTGISATRLSNSNPYGAI